jgi:hypothetical protein
MKDRSVSISSRAYRYGFNTQEKDDEVAGDGNSYTAEFWQYDGRLGRRWNVDPRDVPSFSPYSCFANNPIWFYDLAGDSATSNQSGDQRAKIATNIQSTDSRTYDQVSGSNAWTTDEGLDTVDCSEFCREVALTQYYDPGRTSNLQAKYYQEKGEWTTDISQVNVGDFLFWKNSNGINHTGIVTDITNGVIIVTHAGVQGAKNVGDDGKGGSYEGGKKSLVTSKLDSKGGVWGKTFVGAGRPILKQEIATTTQKKTNTTSPIIKNVINVEPPKQTSISAAPDPSLGDRLQRNKTPIIQTLGDILNYFGF